LNPGASGPAGRRGAGAGVAAVPLIFRLGMAPQFFLMAWVCRGDATPRPRAGQLLRLLSVDALLRKLRFDFSDTFSEGFYFDSIRSTAWIKDGVLHTDDTLVDGLEADIAMKGSVNLVRRELDMEAVVAPEISATVGVAAAFAVNPIVGAAVFAASKVLGPLWSKVSILRYHITGPVDKPQINEVLRQPRKDAQQ